MDVDALFKAILENKVEFLKKQLESNPKSYHIIINTISDKNELNLIQAVAQADARECGEYLV